MPWTHNLRPKSTLVFQNVRTNELVHEEVELPFPWIQHLMHWSLNYRPIAPFLSLLLFRRHLIFHATALCRMNTPWFCLTHLVGGHLVEGFNLKCGALPFCYGCYERIPLTTKDTTWQLIHKCVKTMIWNFLHYGLRELASSQTSVIVFSHPRSLSAFQNRHTAPLSRYLFLECLKGINRKTMAWRVSNMTPATSLEYLAAKLTLWSYSLKALIHVLLNWLTHSFKPENQVNIELWDR